MLSNAAKRSPAGVPKPPPRADSLLLRGDDSGVATSADAPSCSGEYDDHDPRLPAQIVGSYLDDADDRFPAGVVDKHEPHCTANTIRQHYYPEGGWGWVVVVCSVLVQLLSHGVHLAAGLWFTEITRRFPRAPILQAGCPIKVYGFERMGTLFRKFCYNKAVIALAPITGGAEVWLHGILEWSAMENEVELLGFNLKVLGWLNLWDVEETKRPKVVRKIKEYFLLLPIFPAYFGVLCDFYSEVTGNFEDISGIIENLIATVAVIAGVYITTCFTYNRDRIKRLITDVYKFKQLSNPTEVILTEKRVVLYSKIFLTYGVLGTLAYTCLPLYQYEECREKRARSKHSQDIPCGLVTRTIIPQGWDQFPFAQLVFFDHMFTCMIVSLLTLAVTALLCGLLMHIVTQIKYLKKMLLSSCSLYKTDDQIENDVHNCIQYHQMIIEFAKDLDRAFNTMMIMHLTLTSLSISVLGFAIIVVDSISESFRFVLHLGGWIILLLLTCYYGQMLINESSSIGYIAYSTQWYVAKPSVRKDLKLMIMRSQRPLTLSAKFLGVMSLEIFLSVMSSAYSYFTLLLKVKN